MDAVVESPPGEPVRRQRVALGPGQLSKPEKVWSSSSTLIIGFYQAAPYSDAFRIFYKKSGSVFGTQVTLQPATILGPELAVRQPVTGEVQYFEYEIKKLKPSTQYVIKIKTSDAGESAEVRSDKMGTVSYEEERTRDNDMRNFVGAMVKLGEYDGLVLSYAAGSGIFGIRILQLDDLAASLQLARLGSDYTDSGVPVQAYTLSQIRFGRWGGAITGSKVVNEGELKWLVARAVQMGQKSEAAAAFEAEKKMLQTQVELVATNLDSQWADRFRNLRLRAFAYALMLAELDMLHLYRVSLELDVERRVAAGAGAATLRPGGDWDPAAAVNSSSSGSSNSSSSSNNSRTSRSLRSVGLLIKHLAERGNGTADGEAEAGGAAAAAGGGALAAAHGHPPGAAAASWLPEGGQDEEQPDAWMFIHYVSHVYATHLQQYGYEYGYDYEEGEEEGGECGELDGQAGYVGGGGGGGRCAGGWCAGVSAQRVAGREYEYADEEGYD
eukprot:XP_001700520.1 predicted protein [Chlamydomonas reinhardtii]